MRRTEFLAASTVTLITDRRRLGPWGAAGGEAGKPGRNRLERATGTRRTLPGKTTIRVGAGDVIRVETPGGGGWGVAGSG